MSMSIIFMLAGGLGLFLFGMKLMSEGLEKAAGARMRSEEHTSELQSRI